MKKSIKPPATSAADLSADPLDRLKDVGLSLYGNNWKAPLGRELGVSRQTVNNWLTEATSLPPDIDAQLLVAAERARESFAKHARATMSRLDKKVAALRKLVGK